MFKGIPTVIIKQDVEYLYLKDCIIYQFLGKYDSNKNKIYEEVYNNSNVKGL